MWGEMMDKSTFFAEFNISQEDLNQANIAWEDLAKIEAEYSGVERVLREIGKNFIDEYLYDIETAGIHSYRYRTKAAGHLMEKVVRKKKENPEKFAQLDHTNYHKYVTDLIGIRVFSCTVRTGSTSIVTLPAGLKTIRSCISVTVCGILMKIPTITIWQRGPRHTSVPAIRRFTTEMRSKSSRTASTARCITL